MPLYVITGARSDTGEECIVFFCSSSPEAASLRSNKEGIFVSKVICVDADAKKLSSRSIYMAIHGLVEKREYALAFSLLNKNQLIPTDFDFSDVRWLAPLLIAMGKNDIAWKGIQQSKLKPYSGEMYAHEVELLFLFEMEMEITKAEGRIVETLERKILLSIADSVVLRQDTDIESVSLSLKTALEKFDFFAPSLKKCVHAVFNVSKRNGNVAAVFECQRHASTLCREIYLQ